VKAADSVLSAPALLYWSHSAIGVNSGGGEVDGPPVDRIFAPSMAELVAPRSPSTSGTTNTPGSRIR